ncbi:MAG: ATP-binding cassette domain-containing protein, partial [Polaromonas sp.]
LYPNQDRQTSDTELLELLEQVNLPHLAERFGGLDVEMDWVKLLSIGEQQRLAFARVLLARPRFAILDEATSALDIANEQLLYQQLMATDTTPVSVGHRATILRFHDQVLELDGEGHWKTQSAKDYSFNA